MQAIYHYFKRRATWPVAAALLLLFIVLQQGFEWRRSQLDTRLKVLDGRLWYTPAEARCFLDEIKADGRHLYAATQWTLDLAFVCVFVSLQCVFLANLWQPKQAWVLLVPLLGALFDLLENGFTAYLALSYDGQANPVATVSAGCTAAKLAFYLVGSPLVFIVGIVCQSRRDKAAKSAGSVATTSSGENGHESGR